MRKAFMVAVFAVIGTLPLLAQGGGGREGGGMERQRDPERLRQMIMERLVTNYVHEAGLDEGQMTRFREMLDGFYRQRSALERMERQLWQALEAQMRPGVAADEDSLRALMGGLADAAGAKAGLMREHMNELSDILEPIQQAQFMLHFQRFQRQIEMVRMRGMMEGRSRGGGFPMQRDSNRRFDPREFSEQGGGGEGGGSGPAAFFDGETLWRPQPADTMAGGDN